MDRMVRKQPLLAPDPAPAEDGTSGARRYRHRPVLLFASHRSGLDFSWQGISDARAAFEALPFM
jgi:hypothetical protein